MITISPFNLWFICESRAFRKEEKHIHLLMQKWNQFPMTVDLIYRSHLSDDKIWMFWWHNDHQWWYCTVIIMGHSATDNKSLPLQLVLFARSCFSLNLLFQNTLRHNSPKCIPIHYMTLKRSVDYWSTYLQNNGL